jgi:hypothetical protein
MTLLIWIVVILVLVALGVYALSKMPLQSPISWIAPVLVIVCGMIAIAWKAGLVSG